MLTSAFESLNNFKRLFSCPLPRTPRIVLAAFLAYLPARSFSCPLPSTLSIVGSTTMATLFYMINATIWRNDNQSIWGGCGLGDLEVALRYCVCVLWVLYNFEVTGWRGVFCTSRNQKLAQILRYLWLVHFCVHLGDVTTAFELDLLNKITINTNSTGRLYNARIIGVLVSLKN